MRRIKENGLPIFFFVLFLGALIGQSIAGLRDYNSEQRMHGKEPISWFHYLQSSDFGQAMLENWQSEYLQFAVFILATIWLMQRGSNESKEEGDLGLESDQKQQVGGYAKSNAPAWAKVKDWRFKLYSNSLLLVMTVIFFGSWLAHSITGWRLYNEQQLQHHEQTIAWAEYLVNPHFWETTLQNWQSEFLAVGSMAIFTVYLRQRGSPESKPVGSPHSETSSSG
jgi:glycerol uptake facilitator-like aquaporin